MNKWIKARDAYDFFSYLNLYSAGLEKVKAAIEGNNIKKAVYLYRKYLIRKFKEYEPEEFRHSKELGIKDADLLLENKVALLNSQLYDIKDPIDWFMVPNNDQQWQIHLGFMYFQNCLVRAYLDTNNTEYTVKWAKILEDFIENHAYGIKGLIYDVSIPLYKNEYADTCGAEGFIPGYVGGTWLSLVCAIRADSWLYGLRNLIDCKELDDISVFNILYSLVTDHFFVITNNPRRYNPNQFLHNSSTLIKIGIMLNEFKIAPSAYMIGMKWLEEFFDMYVLPDGTDVEQSFNYNISAPDYFWDIYKLFGPNINERIQALYNKIIKRCEFLTLITNPLGQWPDIAKTHLFDVRIKLKEFMNWYDIPLTESILKALESEETAPEVLTVDFPYGGYTVMRNGWKKDSQYLFFKKSRFATGHMHEDCNSIFITAFGENIITDSGNYNYSFDEESNKINDYCFSSFSHSTICVDGEGQRRLLMNTCKSNKKAEIHRFIKEKNNRINNLKKPIASSFYGGKMFDYSKGFYNDGYGLDKIPVSHEREVIYFKDKLWIIIDRMTANDSHKYTKIWQLAAQYKPEMIETHNNNGTIITFKPNSANVLIKSIYTHDSKFEIKYGEKNPYRGWHSGSYNNIDKSVDIQEHFKGEGDLLMATLIYPFKDNKDGILNIATSGNETKCEMQIIFDDNSSIFFKSVLNSDQYQIGEKTHVFKNLVISSNKDGQKMGMVTQPKHCSKKDKTSNLVGPCYEFDI